MNGIGILAHRMVGTELATNRGGRHLYILGGEKNSGGNAPGANVPGDWPDGRQILRFWFDE